MRQCAPITAFCALILLSGCSDDRNNDSVPPQLESISAFTAFCVEPVTRISSWHYTGKEYIQIPGSSEETETYLEDVICPIFRDTHISSNLMKINKHV